MTPAAIDKYEILESLGKGSMGVVYKARDPEIGRLVAIKTLRNVYLGGEGAETEAMKRFRQESRSAGRLRHPNIVTIFEAGRGEDGSPYIVMEFIEGKSLEEVIAERAPIAPQEALHYLSQVASALDYAHSQNVIHRDIKPSNVIVDAYSKPHLLDFGVAKLSDTSLTPAGTVVGTPSYMSPEQIKGEELKGSSDLFALAVLTFELFTGSRPFPGKDFTTVVNNIIHREPISFQELGVNLPEQLESVLRKGLAKDWRDRPKSVLQFVTEVAQVFALPVDSMGLIGGFRAETISTMGTLVAARPVIASVIAPAAPQPANGSASVAPRSAPAPVAALAGVATDPPNEALSRKPQVVSTPLPASGAQPVRGSSKGLWITLLLLLVVGGGGGMFLLTGGKFKIPSFGSTSDSSDSVEGDASYDDGSDVDAGDDETSDVKASSDVADTAKVNPPVGHDTPVVDVKPTATVSPLSNSPIVEPVREPVRETEQPSLAYDSLTTSNIGTLADKEILYILEDQAAPEKAVRLALEDSGKRSGDAFTLRIIKLSQHPSFVVRIDALKALAKDAHRGAPATMDAILARLADEDFLVRGFSAKLISQMGSQSAVPILQDRLLKEDNEKVRAVLQQAIDKIAQGNL